MRITYDRTILSVLAIAGPLTFIQIQAHTGICNDGVRKAIVRLLDDGRITSTPTLGKKMGRRPVFYAIQESRS